MSRVAGLPMREPLGKLPQRVTIYEVGPRDGLQNESAHVPAAVKVEFINRLADAGLRVIEATSFVRPDWVPQLADAAEVMAALAPRPGMTFPVLVPNLRGLQAAQQAGAQSVAIFASATETFARRNLNRSLDTQYDMFAETVDTARQAGLPVRGYLSMCFGDPWEGPVPTQQVAEAVGRLLDLGCTSISLGDTIGVATPGQVTALLELVGSRTQAVGLDFARVGVHFHDTYGQALANTYAALQAGVSTFDSSAGGLGGCPYAKSATGNLATEDLVWMLDGLGIETGVDLDALVATSVWLAGILGRPSPSRVVRALA